METEKVRMLSDGTLVKSQIDKHHLYINKNIQHSVTIIFSYDRLNSESGTLFLWKTLWLLNVLNAC